MEFMSSLQNGIDEHKPSLFELLSEQQLSALIPPSLRYLLALATHRRPRYLLRALNSFDELYALLSLLVERHFLRTYGGSFTENFYGLKRERVLRIKGGEAPRASRAAPALMRETLKLRESDIWKNLAIMVGLPYLKRKLDESYDIHVPQASILGPQYNRNTLPPNPTIKQRILYYYKWFLRNVYPSMNAAYHFSLLAFNLAYLSSNTKYFSPFLWLIGTRIRRMSEADYRAIALAEAQPPAPPTSQLRPGTRPGQTNSIFHPATFFSTIYPRLLGSLRLLLPTSIFALKFLEWWHASDFARQLSRKAAEGLDLPPPIVSGMPLPMRKKEAPPAYRDTNTLKNQTLIPTNTVSLSAPSPSKPETQQQQQQNQPTTPLSPAPSTSPPTSPPPTSTKPSPPISTLTHLPILTVPTPTPATSHLCPICLSEIRTPTAAGTGFVFCYSCIFRWVKGEHERQEVFMKGVGGEEGWGEEEEEDGDEEWGGDGGLGGGEGGDEGGRGGEGEEKGEGREGRWESGEGRCAVTGRRLLGGVEGLRRVMI